MTRERETPELLPSPAAARMSAVNDDAYETPRERGERLLSLARRGFQEATERQGGESTLKISRVLRALERLVERDDVEAAKVLDRLDATARAYVSGDAHDSSHTAAVKR